MPPAADVTSPVLTSPSTSTENPNVPTASETPIPACGWNTSAAGGVGGWVSCSS